MDELKDALQVADLFWKDYDNPDKSEQHWVLWQVLVESTSNSPSMAAGAPEKCIFDYEELATELTTKLFVKPGTIDNKRIRSLLKTLDKRIHEIEDLLNRVAHEHNLNAIPCIEWNKTRGGAGNKASVRLAYQSVDNSEVAQPPNHSAIKNDPSQITYYIESMVELPKWMSWFNEKFALFSRNWMRWAMVGFAMSPFIAIWVAVSYYFSVKHGLTTVVLPGMFSFLIFYSIVYFLFFSYFIECLNNNIALLPDWMLPIRLHSAVLKINMGDKEKKEYRIRGLEIKVYAAKCPICGKRINLNNQGIWYWRRIVGLCDQNPREHKYSFDFTTLRGEKLT